MSVSINKSILQGRLTADPELKTTAKGVAYLKFTLAVDKPYQKDKERQVSFIRCAAWRQSAEFLCKYGKKGYCIFVEGSIEPNTYEKDGVKVDGYNVVADSVKIDFPPKSASAPIGNSETPPAVADIPMYQPGEEDDDLPF